MVPAVVLSLWVGSGLAISWWYHDEHSKRLQWAPVALIFGPLWLPVAYEVRQTETPVE